MVTWKYKIYLWVLKNISQVSTRKDKICIDLRTAM